MGYVYRPLTGGFYSDELEDEYRKSGTWPGFYVRVTDDDYKLLMNGQQNGKMIVPGKVPGKGLYPVLQDRPAVTGGKDAVANAEYDKIWRLSYATAAIAPLQDAVDIDEATEEERNLLLSWKKYRVALNRVDTSKAPAIEWPEKPSS
ncbi:tail fiber assembly protein [Enterobacter roggenkampii]|uniref:tail fiber assembly protein n=1 Tax=Enterobacter roggenkampii TaxID=1812935 RepID=UPI0018C222E3|nr:tail fiber assembly protein [Enterobacter roggenkampii]MBG0696842.1 tail fiber assembly protein [Enterobacter roggenkampii]